MSTPYKTGAAPGSAAPNGAPVLDAQPHHTHAAKVRTIIDIWEHDISPALTAEVVYDHAPLASQGGQLAGPCPWHSSKSGRSFHVDPHSLRWNCFGGCGGGGPTQYVHRRQGGDGTPRGRDFVEVVRELGRRVGVVLPEHNKSDDDLAKIEADEARREALALVAFRSQELLAADTEQARSARAYLARRGLDGDQCKALGLGLFTTTIDVTAGVSSETYDLLIRAGIVEPPNAGESKWADRIVIPWADSSGRLLTIYGRSVGDPRDGEAKTLAAGGERSKRSPLYLDRALRAGHRDLVLVEGVLDAAVAQGHGDDRVIACVAASLSREQVETLSRRGVREVTICLDADGAGDTGTKRCIHVLEQAGIRTYVVPRLPENTDPDDYIIAHGIDAWRERVEQAEASPIYLARLALADVAPTSADRVKDRAAADVAKIVNELDAARHHLREPILDMFCGATGATTPPQVFVAGEQKQDGRPVIVVGTDIKLLVEEAERALAAHPDVYTQDGRIVLYERGQAILLPAPRLLELLSAHATWLEPKGKDNVRPALPPRHVVDALHAPRVRKHLRELRRVALAPCLLADGSVLSTPGYDTTNAILYAPEREYPIVAHEPTEEAARAALQDLLDPLVDFPFEAESDRSAALALMLTIAGRQAIQGPTPFLAVTVSTPGTGKSLLARVCATAMTGTGPRMVGAAKSNEEEQKRMLSWGRDGQPVIFDNIVETWGNETLALVATSKSFTGRVLGRSETATVDVPIIIATGNNLAFTSDLHRRVVPIHLACDVEHPEQRSGFVHGADEELVEYARARHPRLLAAALTLLRWHLTSGRTPTLSAFGSYGAWSKLIRGALVALGLPDPDEGRARISDLVDTDRDHHGTLLMTWLSRLGSSDVPLRVVLASADRHEDLRAVLEALQRRPGKLDTRIVGARLARMRDRIVDGMRLVVTPQRSRGKLWRVERVSPSGSASYEIIGGVETFESDDDEIVISDELPHGSAHPTCVAPAVLANVAS